jgi:CDP-glucose 4,6-dehydratase
VERESYLENLGKLMFADIFEGKKVIITGHTGFKGSWLTLWLNRFGAQITGIALDPITSDDAYHALNGISLCNDLRQDINDFKRVYEIVQHTQPEVIFHLAAQPLVLESYEDPLYTFCTNIIGTANILEACRKTNSVKVIVIVTSDKCYENKEHIGAYNENDRLGGLDPYSSSKACAELVVHSYRESFFKSNKGLSLASVRAGNVIGGGDWAKNRIIPDSIISLKRNHPIEVRNPNAVRPWQYVLEPLGGYLLLAAKMLSEPGKYSEAWNFGPGQDKIHTVSALVDEIVKQWGLGSWKKSETENNKHEAGLLSLDISKSRSKLKWNPVLSFEESVKMTIDWYKAQLLNEDMFKFSLKQIEFYERAFLNNKKRQGLV